MDIEKIMGDSCLRPLTYQEAGHVVVEIDLLNELVNKLKCCGNCESWNFLYDRCVVNNSDKYGFNKCNDWKISEQLRSK